MAESKGKRAVVFLSSSSEEEDDNVAAVLLSSDDDEYQDDLEVIKSDGSDDDIGEEEEESDYPNKDQQEDDDDESLCNKIIRLLTENRELDSLKLKDCKAYLRTYGLRLSGNKSVCLQRIKEHWRLKDGNGETLYPRPSFSINCTGDVCKGDVVLFRQKVYEKLRHGRVLGKRIVVGRVVKESYGTAKQQHTFTVEVFWSRGVKKLPPLFPLLVKGRNLYRMRTFRQCWHDEAERLKVLAEKHRRGDAARSERAMRKTQNLTSNRGMMEWCNFSNVRSARKNSLLKEDLK
ncbi:zinc finger CCCH domain-containing protein 62 [Morus notabilis]|uniref:zinc finger CCCH domain-containing protein 62 n=1 Tax=Morus notabilis TaxID=981085 RepID=UPI000CED056B|nr:zinc finger CCCH domain-containing protein 62 [Morus notabilis]